MRNTPISRLGPAGTRILMPGDLDHSLMYLRVNSTDPAIQMPPLARNRIDQRAADVLATWISTMPPVGALPAKWTNDDIGTVDRPGDCLYADGVFYTSGGGNDIFDIADGFQFVHQPLVGDGQIIARVASIGDGDDWAKAGVMIRETMEAGSRHAFMLVSRTQGAVFHRRVAPGGDTDGDNAPDPVIQAPAWVKLQRQGKCFTGYLSRDGKTWTAIGHVEINMGKNALIGLAVTSHNNATTVKAAFDQVSIR